MIPYDREYARQYYKRNRERILEASRRWHAANPEKRAAIVSRFKDAHPDVMSAYSKKWQANNKDRTKQKEAEYEQLYPEREMAKRAVYIALQAGRLTPLPCWICGTAKAEAHHADYAAPLDVVWLCRKHHRQLHTQPFLKDQQ